MTKEQWTKLYVVRHGQTKWNFEGRWQGWQDSPLTDTGKQQAARAADELRNCDAVAMFTSDSGRAMETAEIIGTIVGLHPQPDAALRERFYGEYEGMTSAEIDSKFPGTRYEAGRDRRDTWRPVGGESLVEVTARVMTFIRQLAENFPGQSIILVTHAGVLRVLDAISSRQSLDEIWDRVPGNCAIFELNANPSGDIQVARHFAPIQNETIDKNPPCH